MPNKMKDHTPSESIIKEFKTKLKKDKKLLKEFCGDNDFNYNTFRVSFSKNGKMSERFAWAIYEYVGKSEDDVVENDAKSKPVSEHIPPDDMQKIVMGAIKENKPDIYESILKNNKTILIIRSDNAIENQ